MNKNAMVAKLIKQANFFLLNSGDDYKQGREVLASFIEGVLHDANKYKGFRYLTQAEMKPGFSYGVEHRPEGNVFPDETRRQYYA